MRYYAAESATPDNAPRLLDGGTNYTRPMGLTLGFKVHESIGDREPWFVFSSFQGGPHLECYVSKLKGVPDIWNSNKFMSPKALRVLVDLGQSAHFQEWPVTLVTRSGQMDSKSTRLVNVFDNVACMNREKSRYRVDAEGRLEDDGSPLIMGIEHLVIDEDKIPPDRHLFRLAEDSCAYLASAELVRRWQAINVCGVKFIPPSQYRSAW